ncbi:MAG: toxic anion resistance protein [Lysinibacillus sp.]
MSTKQNNMSDPLRFTNELSTTAQHYLHTDVDSQTAKKVYDSLSTLDKSRSVQYASQLEISKFESTLTFGHDAQKALSLFSDRILSHIKRKDVSKIGQTLDTLMQTLDRIEPNALQQVKPGLFKRFFSSNKATLKQTLTEYERISIQVERIGLQLDRAKHQLISDVELLEQLYEQNKNYYDELSVYIAAGYMKRKQVLEHDLSALHNKLHQETEPLLFQQINDFSNDIERLDQRIYDLEISQQMAMQMAPQIRMIQRANQTLAEKMQFSIVTLIPLWKNQLAMMIAMNNDEHYAQLENRLKHTNDALQKRHASSGNFDQKISHFQETQLELQSAIQDVFTLHKETEEEREHLQVQIEVTKKAK